jgi:ligand-binding SRPBCC domain-containing protein
MAAHSLKMTQNIPAGIGEVWELFSNPHNLLQLTPPYMAMKITSAGDHATLFPGQLISYRLKPLWGLPVQWTTEIKAVEFERSFIDAQKKGPYRLWEHQHFFKAIEGGVAMTDHVTYLNPMGIGGRMMNGLFIRRQLRRIFEYRYRQVEKIFGEWPGQKPVIHFS